MKLFTTTLLALFFSFAAFATDEIHFVNGLTWAQIKAKALKEKKMIFFDAYATWCGPCKYMENSVYTQKAAGDFFNANFINVKMDMEKGEGLQLSEEFNISAYPTFLFFTPEGKLVHKYVGGMEVDEFVQLGKDAKNPSKQYFTLKDKAQKGLLSDADFSAWASLASDLEDDDRNDILKTYYQKNKDILANKDIAATAILYTSNLTDDQLKYLYAGKAKIMQLLEWDETKTDNTLYSLLFKKAVGAYDEAGNNKDSFMAVIRKFDATRINYAGKDLDFKIALFADKDADKAVNLLISYLKDGQNPVSIEVVGNWFINYSNRFEEAGFTAMKNALQVFKLRAIDTNKEYWLYLMQMLCAAQENDTAKAKEYATKAYQHPQLPEQFKSYLKETYELKD
ncbi:MAG TPA: thioredoxin family protein [Chitinophagaceae bacterium]|nr:thioredoxin family protein [Chitinophagaceae bacterium]